MKVICRWGLVGVLTLLSLPAVSGAQSASDEYRLKAAFVYRFPQFVEWPASAVRDSRTLDVCVLYPNPFGSDLEQMVAGESVSGRPLRVRVVKAIETLEGCHTLFAGAHSAATAAALNAVAGRPVLTVGEDDRFLDAGGIIALKVVDRRVRLDVDAEHARRAGIRISAQLLSLATTVRGGAR